ncbi:sensor histidine kinase [Natronomonas sp. EA1]|uniref:sensor histidine kinase n=1 Tax=Natronomonas sp. EA1 TaxID=3421655 RepID=UPI003EBFBD14
MTALVSLLRERLPPFSGLGLGILTVSLAFVAFESGRPGAVVQAVFPAVIGLGLLLYGRRVDTLVTGYRETVYRWMGITLVAFFLVGAWFGQVSMRFDTSFGFAIFSSIVGGIAFGAVFGVHTARLRRLNDDIERKRDQLSAFSGIVSHDLRNPLNVAMGRVELARETGDETHLDRATGALDRMDRLIAQLLALAREGESIGETEPVSLRAAAEASWEMVATGDARLVVAEETVLEADPDRLQQLLENLFRNSIQHGSPSASRGGTLTVTVGTTDEGFYVADDGPGIPEEHCQTVFEPGQSLGAGGTGFGLAIVARIADAHGWSVRVTESETGGARFEIRT